MKLDSGAIRSREFRLRRRLAISLARSVLGQSSSRPSNPDATMTTALMVKPVM